MNQEQVLELVKERGPVIPSQISKDLNTNILLASAILSDFASRNLVKVSSLKIGGSPLYYLTGQEVKLQDYMARLNPVEKRACELLREKEVLRDSTLDPQTRVALRQAKDFARPLEVTFDKQKEIFWKWYLAPNERAEASIRRELERQELVKKPAAEVARAREQMAEVAKPKPAKPAARLEQEISRPRPAVKAEQPEVLKTKESIAEQIKAKIDSSEKKASDNFQQKVMKFLEGKGISVIEQKDARGSELSCIVKVPNPIGAISYFCHAKNKKSCTEADLSYALVQGQVRKMPVLFLTSGEPTKKAQELLQAPEFSSLTFVKL